LKYIALIFIALTLAPAQTATHASLTADLARYYFASPQAEISARAALESDLQHLAALQPLDSGARLLDALEAYEQVEKTFRRHEGYLHLRCSQNRKDAACGSDEKLQAEVDAKTAFFAPAVVQIPAARLHHFFAAEPRLQTYRFAVDDMRHNVEHILPSDQEALLSRFQPEIGDWQYDLYDQILAGISFGKVQTSSGPLDVVRQRSLLASSPDPQVRREAFQRRLGGYASRRDLLAFVLMQTVKAQNSLAQVHRYPDAPSRKYESMYLDPAQTRALLIAMGEHGDYAKRFEKIRARDFEQAYKTPMQAWDLSAPQPGFTPPITALDDMPGIFHNAFASLGAEYQSAFDALLDPRNGRTDILPGGAPDRYQGGFSMGFTGIPSMLFLGRFDGNFKGLSVIAHEGGHATHRALMSEHGVTPLYADGPSFLFESFAAFNELVLADYMSRHTDDPVLRRYYLEQWLAIKGLDAFYGAQDALLEQQVYDGVAAGKISSADDLDKLSLAVDEQFSTFASSTPALRNRWAAVPLMYEDPLYDVNYVYGGLLALKYYSLFQSNPKDFVPRYIALLRNGFDAPPAALLEKFLHIQLSGPQLLNDDLRLLAQRFQELEAGP
jgi:oligoendopeptidase F